jgi:WD40 repeat protein
MKHSARFLLVVMAGFLSLSCTERDSKDQGRAGRTSSPSRQEGPLANAADRRLAGRQEEKPQLVPRPWSISVYRAAFSPDGKRVLLAYKGAAPLGIYLSIRDAQTGRLLNALAGHKEWVTFCSFLPDGERVVSAGYDGAIIVYQIKGAFARTVLTLEHPGGVNDAALSGDGKFLLTEGADAKMKSTELRLWDLHQGMLVRTFTDKGPVAAMALSPDGELALTGGSTGDLSSWKRGTFKLWNLRTGKTIRSFPGVDGWDIPIGFSANGKGVVIGKRTHQNPPERDLAYWDIEAAKEAKGVKNALVTGGCLHVHNIPGTDTWAAVLAGDPPSARIWELGRDAPQTIVALKPGSAAALSPTARYALVASGRNIEPGPKHARSEPIQVFRWDLTVRKLLNQWEDKTGSE